MRTGSTVERQNIIWNMIGSFCYAFASMILSFLVLGIAGKEQGGIFSFGFSTFGQQMFLLAYFGIRPFHITCIMCLVVYYLIRESTRESQSSVMSY